MGINTNFISASSEIQISRKNIFPIDLPTKQNLFSVLNDVPLNEKNAIPNNFRNSGLALHYSGFSLGYGNWDQWWGPGIHNSLVMTNNTIGIPHYFFETSDYKKIAKNLYYYLKYTFSDGMANDFNKKYFLSSYYLKFRYKNLVFGKSKQILSGGNKDLLWTIGDASKVIITGKNMKYWDQINDYYIKIKFPESKLIVFLELGIPNRSFNDRDLTSYYDHGMASNIGFRKHSAFGNNKLIFGLEYTRLVQGIYFDSLPTPNWYDNIKYNFSSFHGRRWASHSGSDSDDLLIFSGYIDKNKSLVYGINFERHGVTYHYPPEIKFESRISISYKLNKLKFYLDYENEYFRHYGFIDSQPNIWEQSYEPKSIQRTQTLLLYIELLIL